ncbi:hypothetical protein TNIN_300421 [Trichonephila inaurata madagascariensis]|uniref:Uncharacterized protein n=1 Tax=Trichonephila inaurata madagascariensis TaxID=2747483 RepID=A0A8X6YGX0_9ARAC|nr:hypothetical protein TNIN_300421 [Trichonephila inaurata madagascariensis]
MSMIQSHSGVLGFELSERLEIADHDLKEKLHLSDSDSISDSVQSLTESWRILLQNSKRLVDWTLQLNKRLSKPFSECKALLKKIFELLLKRCYAYSRNVTICI